jgi:hypothetical protein
VGGILDVPYLVPLLTLIADAASAVLVDLYGPRDKTIYIVITVLLVTTLGTVFEILRRLHVATSRTSVWSETMRLSNPWLDTWMTDTIRSYLTASHFGNRIVRDNLTKTMNMHRQLMRGFAAGRVEVDYMWPGFFSGQLARAKAEIRATSLVDPKSYWETPKGRDHLHEHHAAMARAQSEGRTLTIRRLFIQSENDIDALTGVVAEQIECGIDVRIALREHVDSKYLEDYMVVDSDIVMRLLAFEKGQPTRAEVRWAIDDSSNVAEDYRERFDTIWEQGRAPGDFAQWRTTDPEPKLGASGDLDRAG